MVLQTLIKEKCTTYDVSTKKQEEFINNSIEKHHYYKVLSFKYEQFHHNVNKHDLNIYLFFLKCAHVCLCGGGLCLLTIFTLWSSNCN